MITQEKLKEISTYDEENGGLIRNHTSGGALKGTQMGSVTQKGYKYASINKKGFMIHRLVWLYHYGKFPKHQIDHIDGDRLNNRLSNLREAITSQNCANQGLRKNNTTGFRGVVLDRDSGLYLAQCNAGGKHYYLGRYTTPEEASTVREAFAKEHHKEFYKPL